MVVRILSLRIQWILYISMCPWLLTYGLGKYECLKNENENTLWCGKSQLQHNCTTVTCVQRNAERITRGFVLWSHHCNGGKYPKYGYSDNYIWTTDCCLIFAKICYQATSADSDEDMTNDDHTSHGQASTMKTTNFEDIFTTPEDIFNSTGIVDMEEETVPTVSEIKAEEYIGKNSAMIGLYAGLPVGLFLFVAVLAVVCYIFRDKLKIVAGKFRKQHREGLYQESGTTSKSFHHNPIETEANSSCSKYRPGYEELGVRESCNTYDTIGETADPGRFDPTCNHIH